MISKSYSKKGTSCRVTFKVSSDLQVGSAAVLGDFNEWSPNAHPLTARKDGSFSTTVSLEAGKEYRFRYLLDGERWTNDEDADSMAPNQFGGHDGVIAL